MQPGSTNRRQYGAMIAVVACAFGMLLGQWNISSVVDNQFFDAIQRSTSYPQQDANVLLVYTDERTMRDPDRLLPLITKINEHSPQRIAILFDYEKPIALNDLDALPGSEKIAIGKRKSNWLAPRNDLGSTQGFIDLDSNNQLILRDHQLFSDLNATRIPTLEYAIASEILPSRYLPQQNQFGIRFCGSANSLPNVTEAQVTESSIVADLVADKIVMIAPTIRVRLDIECLRLVVTNG